MRDFVVKILVKLGLYLPCVNLINRLKFEVQARRMRRHGLKMLAEAEKAFDEAGVQAFLTYGCLLGAYRDHGFISYDPDIDLGILAEQVPDNMGEILRRHGFTFYRQGVLDDPERTIIERTYVYRNLHLDIFYYYREGADFYSVISRKHESLDWKEANRTNGFPCDRSYVPACEMERRNFLGLNIWMPCDTDGWLRAIYSDSYMTPIKNWDAKDGYVTRIVHTLERSYREFAE